MIKRAINTVVLFPKSHSNPSYHEKTSDKSKLKAIYKTADKDSSKSVKVIKNIK